MDAPPGTARTTSTTRRFDPAGNQIAPHVSQQARDQLDDLGLVDDDDTEDMRKPPAYGQVSYHLTAEGNQNRSTTK